MGAGNSTSYVSGVTINPRLEFADTKARKEGEHMLIDAPSLVKLQTGTVRYRYVEDGTPIDKTRVEKPHESQSNLDKKGGYFYHARLKNYGYDAEPNQEDDFKFCYVYKGATKTRQKQLYYVFGKGLKTNEKGFIEPKYKSEADLDETPPEKFYKFHGHMYYDIRLLPEEVETDVKPDSDVMILGDGKVETDSNEVEAIIKAKDKVSLTKRRLAIKLYKPAAQIHLYRNGHELQNEDPVIDPKLKHDGKKKLKVLLVPKQPDAAGEI